jgi:hypothetical protein
MGTYPWHSSYTANLDPIRVSELEVLIVLGIKALSNKNERDL